MKKTFLFYEPGPWNEKHGALTVIPVCCITANSIEEVSEKTGGKLVKRLIASGIEIEVEETDAVVFERFLFNSIKGEEDGAGEYQKGELFITIHPDEEEIVYFIKEIQHIH